jgi:hypothetical protein
MNPVALAIVGEFRQKYILAAELFLFLPSFLPLLLVPCVLTTELALALAFWYFFSPYLATHQS